MNASQASNEFNENLINNKLKALSDLEGSLLERTSFDFKLKYDNKKLLRSGIILLLISSIVGASLGVLLFYILKWTGITSDYAILGIGSGLGAGFGVILGTLLYVGLQTRIIEEYGAGYGIGISVNIFIGATIGVLFGAGVGALFGLILEALNYSIDTNFIYPVYGMLVWIVLGLNIGVIVGLITSFGFVEIIFGGAISGMAIGTIGLLIYYGPELIILIGTATGLVSGILIGILVKFSIRASLGTAKEMRCLCNPMVFEYEKKSDTRERRRAYYCGSNYVSYDTIDCANCGTRSGLFSGQCNCMGRGLGGTCCGNCGHTCSNCGSTCCGSNCGLGNFLGMNCGAGNCFGAGFFVVILLIPLTLIISIASWFSARASVRLGKRVRKGAITALTSSTSIGLLIGSNIAMIMSFRSFSVYAITGISIGFGLVYSLILFLAYIISMIVSDLNITSEMITWKDRYTSGSLHFANVEDYTFIKEGEIVEGIAARVDDYVRFDLVDGSSQKVILSCWNTPYDIDSFEYIKTIIEFYHDRAIEELITPEEEEEEEEKREDKNSTSNS
ncbi:MAG: hypothetical protein FK733_04210 [Asgard group archaeon]|nr:hypothetical protein [Asgard group archaeon]